MHATIKFYHPDFDRLSKGQTSIVLSSIFCRNPVPNVYFTTPVEEQLESLSLTRDPSWLVLKIYGKSDFLKMSRHLDHDNLRSVFLQMPIAPPIRIDFRSLESHFSADTRIL